MAYSRPTKPVIVRKKKGLFSFLGETSKEVHYAELIPPMPGMYSGPGPYTSEYPAPAMRRTPEMQMTPEQAYPEIQELPSMPEFTSYNPFAGLGFFENPELDSEYVAPPPPPAPAPVVVKPVSSVFSYNPFSGYWKK